jgi:replicative DNA helicase
MSRSEVGMRILAAEARVPLHVIRSGQLTEGDWHRIALTLSRVADAPIYIDASPNLTLTEIRARAQRLKREHGLRLVVVDYLQLMDAPPGAARRDRRETVDALSRGLKMLAKQLDVPVLALAQLNRGPENRQDKHPALADLRESGQIEADADVVILIHREDAYARESPRAGEADLIVAKHRNGPIATITVAFQGHYSRFVDMGPMNPEPTTTNQSTI